MRRRLIALRGYGCAALARFSQWRAERLAQRYRVWQQRAKRFSDAVDRIWPPAGEGA